jgi:hypothetical protein
MERKAAPADRALIFLYEPGIDALLVMHVHAWQQPHFIAFRKRHKTNAASNTCIKIITNMVTMNNIARMVQSIR